MQINKIKIVVKIAVELYESYHISRLKQQLS